MPASIDPFAVHIPRAADLALLLPGFEAIAEAEIRRQTLERGLRRAGNLELANRLAACSSGPLSDHHCLSGACPICMRAWRRWFFAEASRVAEDFQDRDGNVGCVVSLVPRDSQAAASQLQSFDLKLVGLAIRRGLGKLNLGLPAIGGLDISLNEDARQVRPPHFQIHANFAIFGIKDDAATRRRLGQVLASVIPVERTASRPILIQRIADRPRQLSYLLKATFTRRLSIVDRQGRANTLPFPMKMAQAIEVATLLDTHTVLDRLVLHGVDLRGSRMSSFKRA